jgi:hypothetical protein
MPPTDPVLPEAMKRFICEEMGRNDYDGCDRETGFQVRFRM